MTRGPAVRIAAAAVVLHLSPSTVLGQVACEAPCRTAALLGRSWVEATTGSPLEQYLRALQLDTARSRPYPQTVRGFAPHEIARMTRSDTGGPWGRERERSAVARRAFGLLRPGVTSALNTTFPFGMNDGPMWAGRGLSASVDAGGWLALGPLFVRVQPVLVWAQNLDFPLFDRTGTSAAPLADPIGPIDLPQRFGTTPYHRIGYGDSEVRLDLLGVTAGVSNARETWGPAVTHPLILGPNAPGFAHGFVGTSRPIPIGIGRLHGRVIAGRLDQTRWSRAADSLARRLGTGAVVTFMPGRGRSLELGATRFFHRPWPSAGVTWRSFGIPLTGVLLKEGALGTDDPDSPDFLIDNQLASVFVRWAPVGAAVELYGEYARNDAALNLRELITEPDHQRAYTLGARKLVRSGPARLRVARLEWVGARITHLDRVRPQGLFYTHDPLVQGHTNRGKVLGSVAVPGGTGLVLGWDEYGPRGASTLELHRVGRLMLYGEGAPSSRQFDVQYVARYERTRFSGAIDLVTGAAAVWEPNRNFRGDAFNLNVSFSARFGTRAAGVAR